MSRACCVDIEPLDIESSENLEYLQCFEFYDKQQLENDLVSARDPEKTPLKASPPCDELCPFQWTLLFLILHL